MQLIRAEERYKISCENYRDAYHDAMTYVNKKYRWFLLSVQFSGFSGLMRVSVFKKTYDDSREKNKSLPMCVSDNHRELDRKIDRLAEAMDMSSFDAFFSIHEHAVWSICFESLDFLHKIEHGE